MPRDGDDMEVSGVTRDCCVVAVDGGVFGCAGTSCRIVECVGVQ